MFNRLQQFVEKSNSTNSNTDKIEVIKEFSNDHEVMRALRYTYSPFKQYYITSKNLKKRSDLVASSQSFGYDIITLLDSYWICWNMPIQTKALENF